MKLGTASASDRLQAFECEGKERPFDSRRPQQSLIGWTDPLCACISLISVFVLLPGTFIPRIMAILSVSLFTC